jgi:hypothetical protein
MVDLVQQYDPDAEANSFDDLPPGTYEAEIVESGREPISKEQDLGECLNLCWKVISGELEGRLFWQRLNLWWTGNEKTPGQVVKIANGQFKDLRDATGVQFPSDSAELHNIPCLVTYGPQKKNPQYSEVKSVKAAGGTPARQTATGGGQHRQSAPAQQQGRPAASGSAPWRKAG